MSLQELADVDPLSAAALVLGGRLDVGAVSLRIVEVEAYGSDREGPWPDPAAHSYPGPTQRNWLMFGPPGRLYVYRSYGMHWCANITCGPPGVAAAVLLRAGEVVAGIDEARIRRTAARADRDLARGPGNLASAMGIVGADYGTDLDELSGRIRFALGRSTEFRSGPRVGVSVAADRPWRLWLPSSAAVSAYRRSPRAPAGA